MKEYFKPQNFLIVAALSLAVACNNNASDGDTNKDTTAATTENEKRTDTAETAELVRNSVAANLAEVRLAQLGQQKSTNAEIRNLAQMLETDHKAVVSQLQDYASKHNIASLPTEEKEDAKETYNDLSKKSGKDFDKDWCDAMESKHKGSIDKFENAANDNDLDPELKTWIGNTLPKLRMHLDMVQQTKNKLK